MIPGGTDRRIPLRDGPTVPERVVLWLLETVDHGLTLRLEGDRILVAPRERLMPADSDFIRQHRADLFVCLEYVDRIAAEPLP